MKKQIFFLSSMLFSLLLGLSFAGDFRNRVSSFKSDYSNLADIETEIKFGRDLAARILGNYHILENDKINYYINLIGKAVSLHGRRAEIRYYFAVLDTNEINAFAVPGGYVFITKGLLKEIENEAQLAAVLGHEIAHIESRHVIKELKIRGDKNSAASGLAALIGGSTGSFKGAFTQMLDNAADILFKRGYLIKDEIEADRLGILMASVAGYDPSALKILLNKVKHFESGSKAQASDHPFYNVRIDEINNTLKANGLWGLTSALVKERYHENINL